MSAKKTFFMFLYTMVFFLHSPATKAVEEITNLQTFSQQAMSENKVAILYMSATHCVYCMKLNRDVVNPMMGNKGYQKSILLQKLEIDLMSDIINFDGQTVSRDDLIERYNIIATPTLLFVNERGEEIAERLEGYQSEEFYWYYLDKSIEQATKLNEKR